MKCVLPDWVGKPLSLVIPVVGVLIVWMNLFDKTEKLTQDRSPWSPACQVASLDALVTRRDGNGEPTVSLCEVPLVPGTGQQCCL